MKRIACLLVVATIASFPAGGYAGARGADRSALDGRWNGFATRAELLRKMYPSIVAALCGPATGSCPATVEFANGHFHFHTLKTEVSSSGTFRVVGNLVRLVFSSGVGVTPGTVAECGWSVYRDRLTFTEVPARPCLGWDSAPWVRAS